jgi:ParB family chromosome partitioning protein
MNKTQDSRRALGRGLSALLPQRPSAAGAGTAVVAATQAGGLSHLDILLIDPNPLQPRRAFRPDRLQELVDSIKAHGVLQPLIVRRKAERYELVAGERRWRAAKLAGIPSIPALIQDFADDTVLEVALVENLQREDLNPIEIAQAFDRLSRELGLSHDEIGRRTGKDRASITNTLRLLRLPADLQLLIAEHRLSQGHAKAILALPTEELQRQVAEKACAQGMSVRSVERLVQKLTEPREPKAASDIAEDPNVKAAVDELQRVLGPRVRIVQGTENRGRLEIDFYSQDDLDRIYLHIVGEMNLA